MRFTHNDTTYVITADRNAGYRIGSDGRSYIEDTSAAFRAYYKRAGEINRVCREIAEARFEQAAWESMR